MRMMRYAFIVLGWALLGCGGSQQTQSEPPPLPPLKPTKGLGYEVSAKGGTVVDPAGKTVDVSGFYKDANAVLVFYRGAW